ncbi:MAG: hypothetical protein ACM3ML_13865 [Micromonosporaceae bacterium]
MSGGRIGTGVYLTRLITIADAGALLHRVFSRVEAVPLRYHLVFAAWPRTPAFVPLEPDGGLG